MDSDIGSASAVCLEKKKNSTYIDEQTMKLYFVGIFKRDAGNGR